MLQKVGLIHNYNYIAIIYYLCAPPFRKICSDHHKYRPQPISHSYRNLLLLSGETLGNVGSRESHVTSCDSPTPSISFQSATLLSGMFHSLSFPSSDPLRKYLSSFTVDAQRVRKGGGEGAEGRGRGREVMEGGAEGESKQHNFWTIINLPHNALYICSLTLYC